MNPKQLVFLLVFLLVLPLVACSREIAPARPDAGDAGVDDGGATVSPESSRDAAPSSDGGAADAGGDGAVVDEELSLTLAPRGRATVSFEPWALRGEIAEVEDGGAGSVVESDGGAVTLDALRSARGATSVAIRSRTGRARALLRVTYDPAPWAYVAGEAYRVELAAAPAPLMPSSEAELWHVSTTARFGTERTPGSARAVRWSTPTSTANPVPLPQGATGATLRHGLWGSLLEDGAARPARLDETTGAWATLPWSSAAEIYDSAGGALVGALSIGGVPHAIRCANDAEASCETIEPVGATASTARALTPGGEVLGCADVAGVSRPFVKRPGRPTDIAPAPAVGCLSGVAGSGLLVGEVAVGPGETWGFAGAAADPVRVDRAWGTRLFGGAGGALWGSARDVEGHWRAASFAPLVAPARIRLGKGREAPDPELAHACGHTTLGPFASLVATDAVDTTSTILRTHTSYAVTRAPAGPTSFLKLSNTRAGQVTLHLSRFVPVRIIDPDGAPLAPAFADDTERCADLAAFVQFDLPKVGAYVIALGPTPLVDLRIVYERTWIVAR